MKVTIESTEKIVTLNGIQARIWEGFTESGIKCHAYVPLVAVDEGQDERQFEKELKKVRKPSAGVEAIPFQLIL